MKTLVPAFLLSIMLGAIQARADILEMYTSGGAGTKAIGNGWQDGWSYNGNNHSLTVYDLHIWVSTYYGWSTFPTDGGYVDFGEVWVLDDDPPGQDPDQNSCGYSYTFDYWSGITSQ